MRINCKGDLSDLLGTVFPGYSAKAGHVYGSVISKCAWVWVRVRVGVASSASSGLL
jgi:hypothetical protein